MSTAMPPPASVQTAPIQIEGSPYGFDGPRYLNFDDAGRLYVADK